MPTAVEKEEPELAVMRDDQEARRLIVDLAGAGSKEKEEKKVVRRIGVRLRRLERVGSCLGLGRYNIEWRKSRNRPIRQLIAANGR